MRVQLVPKDKVRPDQKNLYDKFVERVQGNYSVFTTMRLDGALLGPWAVWLQVPKTGETIRQYIETVEAMPGLKTTTVQAVILSTGAHFNAAYEMYAHAAVAESDGLQDDQVASLSAGELPHHLDPEARFAVEIARRLLHGGVLPGPVFRRGIAELGQDGFDHLVYLVSQYCLVSVSISLNAYDVSAEDGLDS